MEAPAISAFALIFYCYAAFIPLISPIIEPPTCTCGGFVKIDSDLHYIYRRVFDVSYLCEQGNESKCSKQCTDAAKANTDKRGLRQMLASVNLSVGNYACRLLGFDTEQGELVVQSKLCNFEWKSTDFSLPQKLCCIEGKMC